MPAAHWTTDSRALYMTDKASFEQLAPIFGRYFVRHGRRRRHRLWSGRCANENRNRSDPPEEPDAMPIAIFAMFVFGICLCSAPGGGSRDAQLRGRGGIPTWMSSSFPPCCRCCLPSSLPEGRQSRYRHQASLSRALAVAILTWLALASYISFLWCPAIGCSAAHATGARHHGGGRRAVVAGRADRGHRRRNRVKAPRRLVVVQGCAAQNPQMKHDAN